MINTKFTSTQMTSHMTLHGNVNTTQRMGPTKTASTLTENIGPPPTSSSFLAYSQVCVVPLIANSLQSGWF